MKHQWWKESVVYQIYPRSFKDSNQDGIGDLRGIIQQIDYLVWLGVNAVWLNPIYDSPNDDMGYDIRDYETIMTEFGTMEDFDELLDKLHQNGIRLIMDLVVNHTSDEHPWFVESRKSKENPYRDFYIWREGKDGKEPNNWASFFTPSAWDYDEETQEWYLHLFSKKQPDLNWNNKQMRESVYQMMNRWFDKGVDGFRMDVINLIAKHPDLPDGESDNNNRYVFSDRYFAMQPKLHDYLREMRKACFDGRDCMCVGETPFVNTNNANSLLESSSQLDMIFQFELMDIDSKSSKWDVAEFSVPKFKQLMSSWQKAVPWNSLFWSNHDQPRAVSRFGDVSTEESRVLSAKMLAIAMHLLKGTSFLYQGEEIGMTNCAFSSFDQLRDIESINFYRNAENGGYLDFAWNGILKKGRDNARTVMQWDDTKNAGFSKTEPWIMVNPNYTQINVASQQSNPNSILDFYRNLIQLKLSNETLIYGEFDLIDGPDSVFSYTRTYQDEQYLIVCNMKNEAVRFDFSQEFIQDAFLLSNYTFHYKNLLQPYEAFVVRLGKNHD